ncbi:alpha-amylase [Lactobacillus sp.] [Lactiplantibacillus mudanjiangensis]|uniref:alpha-amylase family glycosyl hydrolase n=1 Tax=Lactiplantibacillus mudanjiangensis TaxID=1296538 RepID=UPI001013F6CB|nr:alpha-amylase family glycosyl hydrolase [Lactiplantibacillus mudanjiangensis]VDG31809.1 alpha-amylase [Lactobacillus sp.] [Lactiplantibacillus mudanjiangensis]
MAKTTNVALRSQLIYSIFPRNYTEQGGFKAIQADLPRIKALGTDIIWLMPIYPVGEKNRKGALGSPYAIKDYRGINPELGTRADFEALTQAIHEQGMRVILDIVYNHTSPDSLLVQQHPDWFFKKPNGQFGNRVADWSDIIDLDYANHELWDYQIETLKQWAQFVDGFRCDVAPLVPLEFWLAARQALAAVKPNLIWLAESNDPQFLKQVRDQGFEDLSDSELYQAFDMVYDYDVIDDLHDTAAGKRSLAEFARILMKQDVTFPRNYVKMRFLENHDVPRATSYLTDPQTLRNWLAFNLFEKGSGLIYAGQEFGQAHLPSLFDADPVALTGPLDLSDLIQRVATLKHQELLTQGAYTVTAINDQVMQVQYRLGDQLIVGLFALRPFTGTVACELTDGKYLNQLTDTMVTVKNHQVLLTNAPIILQK